MNQTLATPPPATAIRGYFARLWADPDTRSTLVGLAGVLLFHLFLWLTAPQLLRVEVVPVTPRPNDAASKQFNIEIAPDVFEKKKTAAPPNKFVEANPDAPDNVPDKTENFSDRNQQVAQEKPTPDGKSDRPAIEGKKDFENSTQIVSGQLTQPIEHVEAVPPTIETPPSEALASALKALQNPLPGFEKKEGENKEAYGSNITRLPENVRPIPERIDGAKDAPLIEGAMAIQPAIDPKRPQPRPQLERAAQVRPAILAEHKFGTPNIGLPAYDAKWSNYGEYLKRMIESIQIQWERILVQSRVSPPAGTFVVVKFILDSEGKIAQIVKVDNQSNQQGESACLSAIIDRAPYGAWTDDMKAVLGEQQELTFSFYYQ